MIKKKKTDKKLSQTLKKSYKAKTLRGIHISAVVYSWGFATTCHENVARCFVHLSSLYFCFMK